MKTYFNNSIAKAVNNQADTLNAAIRNLLAASEQAEQAEPAEPKAAKAVKAANERIRASKELCKALNITPDTLKKSKRNDTRTRVLTAVPTTEASHTGRAMKLAKLSKEIDPSQTLRIAQICSWAETLASINPAELNPEKSELKATSIVWLTDELTGATLPHINRNLSSVTLYDVDGNEIENERVKNAYIAEQEDNKYASQEGTEARRRAKAEARAKRRTAEEQENRINEHKAQTASATPTAAEKAA